MIKQMDIERTVSAYEKADLLPVQGDFISVVNGQRYACAIGADYFAQVGHDASSMDIEAFFMNKGFTKDYISGVEQGFDEEIKSDASGFANNEEFDAGYQFGQTIISLLKAKYKIFDSDSLSDIEYSEDDAQDGD